MLHVAVLDDRKTNRSILLRLAQSVDRRVEVEGFDEAQALLSRAEASAPDLVITDYRMPEMNGADFIRAFRRIPDCALVPVMVVTAYDQRDYRYDALRAGATDFLVTPLDRVEFRSRARNLLTMRRQQRIIGQRARRLERILRERTRVQQSALRNSEERLRLTVNAVPAMINAVDDRDRCVFVNNEQGLFFGLDPELTQGCSLDGVFGTDYAHRHGALNAKVRTTGQSLGDLEETIDDQTGAQHVFLTTKAPIFDVDDNVASIVTVSVEITRRKELERILHEKVYYDSLTGLPNRVLFHDRLGQALERAHQQGGQVGLLYLDLDQFKDINAAWGHSVGDEVLKGVATRLAEGVTAFVTMARGSADEFLVVYEGSRDTGDFQDLGRWLIDLLREPVPTQTSAFSAQASVGIAVYPHDGDTPEELLKNANSALAQAKAAGGNRVAFYAPALTRRAHRRLYLETELKRALASSPEELGLAAQAIVSVRDAATRGWELLLRWRHPTEGAIGPDQFVPVAEASGLIDELGRHVLMTAARWWAASDKVGRFSVNLSPAQVMSDGLLTDVRKAMEHNGLGPGQLELEITENALVGLEAGVIDRFRALRSEGVAIAIDDFGTGFSSLQYIKELPVDRLKIDRCFVRDVARDRQNQAIVRAILTLTAELGLAVTAEGVETPEDAAALEALGVDEAQGFYYAQPGFIDAD